MTVAMPSITPSGGIFADSVTIQLATATPEAVIYYTLDGSNPTESSTLYAGSFVLTQSATVKAIGIRSGFNNSVVASAAFTITTGSNTPPTLNPIGNKSAREGRVLNFVVTANDPDAPPVLSASGLPSGARFDPSTGVFNWTPPAGAAAGSPYSLTFKATDAADTNLSMSETVMITVQASGITLFSDDFSDGNANGWVVVKDSSRNPDWKVTNGRYQQNNGASGFVQSFHVGTYAYYANGFDFTDYELNAKISPLGTGSVGVMFRYKDKGNYYRFSMSETHGFSRLERKVNGDFKTLSFNGIGPDFGKTHTVTIEVQGPRILVYLDGEPLFGTVDTNLSTGTIALYTQGDVAFDDIIIASLDSIPKLVISQPSAYFVETTGTLDIAAVASGVPSKGGVQFIVDNGRSFIDSTPPYSGSFSNLLVGDHTIDAVIVDDSGLPLASPLAQDTNATVGLRGKYLVAMGDSITNGVGDDVAADDASQDQRNISRGFTPILNDLLTAHLGRPITVFNEGIGGTTAGNGIVSGASRINSTKEQHNQSQVWLIMFGTNDSGRPVPSGKGLLPGDGGYSGSFKDSMQRIISSLKQSDKIPVLAKVPFILNASATRDRLVRDYNAVIDELVAANNIPVNPPDFYTYFKQHPNLMADNLHPNGSGYQAMANLWSDALIGSGILDE